MGGVIVVCWGTKAGHWFRKKNFQKSRDIGPSIIIAVASIQRDQCILFSVVFTPPPPSHHGSVWLLLVISLLLTNTVSPVRAYQSIWLERFRRCQKEDERGPLSIQFLSITTTVKIAVHTTGELIPKTCFNKSLYIHLKITLNRKKCSLLKNKQCFSFMTVKSCLDVATMMKVTAGSSRRGTSPSPASRAETDHQLRLISTVQYRETAWVPWSNGSEWHAWFECWRSFEFKGYRPAAGNEISSQLSATL